MDINQFNFWAKNHIFDDSKFDDDGFLISQNNYNFLRNQSRFLIHKKTTKKILFLVIYKNCEF